MTFLCDWMLIVSWTSLIGSICCFVLIAWKHDGIEPFVLRAIGTIIILSLLTIFSLNA